MSETIYLLTGAAGFLGSHICDELLEKNKKVRALVLKGDPSAKYIPDRVEIVEGNLCDMDSLDKFFAIPEKTEAIVIHCASMVTRNPQFSQKLVDINVGGTRNMISQCLQHKEVKRMVYVSSTGAIPECQKGEKIREVSSFDGNDERIVGWYSKSKAIATQAVLDAVRSKGLDAVVVHPSGIMGPKDYAMGEVTSNVVKIMSGELPIGMGGSFNLCDVRDLAHGCIMAAAKGRTGECYILANEEITFKTFCRTLEKEAGGRGPKFFLPTSIAMVLAARMEKKAAKTGKEPVMNTFAVYNLARNNDYDYSKAQKELGYQTRPYSETLKDMAMWLIKEGKISGQIKTMTKSKKAVA